MRIAVADEERVLAHMNDAAAGRRMLQMRNPRHIGFQRNHQIGIGEQRAGLVAEMHRMAGRQADAARVLRDDGNGAAFGQPRQHRHRVGGQSPTSRSAAVRRRRSIPPASRLFSDREDRVLLRRAA